jgi:hypothetical protein
MLEEPQSLALTSCFPSTPRSGALVLAPLAPPAGGRAAGGRQPSSGWPSPWPCAGPPSGRSGGGSPAAPPPLPPAIFGRFAGGRQGV